MFIGRKKSNNFGAKNKIYFFILFLVLSGAVYLVLIDAVKQHNVKASVLLLPKNEKIAVQLDEVTQNVAEIPRNLYFYEKFLRDNAVDDFFEGYPKDEKKERWNKKVKTRILPGSSVVEVEITDKNRSDALVISNQAVKTLFGVVAGYYNIKSELDMRIIESPVSKTVFGGWYWILAVSVASGAAISGLVIVVWIENLLKRIFFSAGRKKEIVFPRVVFEKKEENRIKGRERLEKTIAGEDEIFFGGGADFQIPAQAVKKAQAPGNLPVMESAGEDEKSINAEIVENKDPVDVIGGEKKDEKEDISPRAGDPTEEEAKERLNQLLRGN